MELVLSIRTKQRLFDRKMVREGYAAKIYTWENKSECMLTHIDRVNTTVNTITYRFKRHNSMGEFNSPVYNIRASRIIRDTDRMLKAFKDPQERQAKMDASRQQELRDELKDKFRAMCNRNMFFGQIG